MHIMADERPYNSDFCFRHANYVNNFKGLKTEIGKDKYTKEFISYMEPITLVPIEIEGKKYYQCPKCHIKISSK